MYTIFYLEKNTMQSTKYYSNCEVWWKECNGVGPARCLGVWMAYNHCETNDSQVETGNSTQVCQGACLWSKTQERLGHKMWQRSKNTGVKKAQWLKQKKLHFFSMVNSDCMTSIPQKCDSMISQICTWTETILYGGKAQSVTSPLQRPQKQFACGYYQ